MKYKVGDKVRIKRTLSAAIRYGGVLVNTDMVKRGGEIATITKIYDDGYNISGDYWFWNDEMLEPADNIVRMADGTIIGDFSTGGFCDGFRGGKIPSDLIVSRTEIERTTDLLLKALEKPSVKFGIKKLEQKLKEEKNLKFTFHVTEGTRVDKSCNGTIPTMTTVVEANSYSRTAPVGIATCDKADYDMRQGVLEALANMYCDGDFDKVYNKAVKRNELADKKKRTCTYCGKVFDTVEEKQAEEAWHIERKKARRERYLLRKRAKEIAFEEQAQKMAKEMMGEQK